MSKYTTELRFICENKAGMKESVGCGDVDKVLDQSWNKIFTTKAPIFDESYRAGLCKKILKNYYLREIGAEVVGIWQLWMNTKFEQIMPYYNQLYESALLEFSPFYDVDITTSGNTKGNTVRNIDGTENAKLENNASASESGNSSSDGNESISGEHHTTGNTDSNADGEYTDKTGTLELESDTPQGGITGLRQMNYLTRAATNSVNAFGSNESNSHQTLKDDSTTSENKNRSDSSEHESTKSSSFDQTNNVTKSSDEEVNSTEDYLRHVTGKQSGVSYSSRLKEFRDTFLNIDMMVIDEFRDLFMMLY